MDTLHRDKELLKVAEHPPMKYRDVTPPSKSEKYAGLASEGLFRVMDAVVPARKNVKTTSDLLPTFPATSKHPAVVSFRQSTSDKVRAKAANLKRQGPPQAK